MSLILYPANANAYEIELFTLDLATGETSPLTAGSVIAFLSTSGNTDATPADDSLEVACVHRDAQYWLVPFSATICTKTLLDSKFGSAACHLVVTQDGKFVRSAPVNYVPNPPLAVVV